MEDQQPAAGDLTDETKEDRPEVDAAVKTRAAETKTLQAQAGDDETAAAEVRDAEQSEEADSADPDAEADETAAAKKGRKSKDSRRRRRSLAAVAVVAAVLFVGSAAFAGATMHSYLADRATAATKLRVARTAANAITTLWTYTPENMDSLPDRAAAYLSGDFAAQYRTFVDPLVGPNKQAKVTNSTQVSGVGIESLDDQNAVAIVYTNTTSTSPLTKNIPSLKYMSYRLFMKRDNGRWLVTKMTTITKLDLTPQL